MKLDLRIDVAGVAPLPGPLNIALTVFLPDPAALGTRPIAMAAFPGGGYGRGYFDIHFPGHDGYSEAAHHTAAGLIFIACDHLGVDHSTVPDLAKLTIVVFRLSASDRCWPSRRGVYSMV